jgi:hypothetical protein
MKTSSTATVRFKGTDWMSRREKTAHRHIASSHRTRSPMAARSMSETFK